MISYTVLREDTLDSIARKYGVSTIDIINSNNLNSYFLTPGTVLNIPSPQESAFIDYTVKPNDTLYNIAREYNVDPVLLSEINGLKLYDYIYPNQIIIIPKSDTTLYITKDGDTIGRLINDNIVTLQDLNRYNRNVYLMPEQLIIGRKFW